MASSLNRATTANFMSSQSIAYTIRESQKAKRVSLRISATGDLEVVIPPRFDRRKIPAIVQQKQRWIERTTQRLQPPATATDLLPETIELVAIAQAWQVDYLQTHELSIKLQPRSSDHLILSGAIGERSFCQTALQQWISHCAKTHLIPWLHNVSQEISLPFAGATIRQQKTLWGSCSGRKTISLNCKLLFLPTQLVRYVLIHELCHTVHMNHSAQFWALVASHEPDYKLLDTQLRSAHQNVPRWMEAR
jgi:predicted metal-dependent hydrolase